MIQMLNVTPKLERLLVLCRENLEAANAFARDLGYRGFHPEKPQTEEEALRLLSDLRVLRFDLANRIADRGKRKREFERA
ncbi:MAG: hypothetical protein WCK01_03230 [Candidatus Uhrbacteria bacterium]